MMKKKHGSSVDEAFPPENHNRDKLADEIRNLQLLIQRLEDRSSSCNFGDLQGFQSLLDNSIESDTPANCVPNVSLNLERDMYRYSGMHCVNFENTYTFEFSGGRKITKDEQYAVEIFVDDGVPKLGKWVLPMAVDIEEILGEYPIAEFRNFKPFLRTCKHQVNCYIDRREQYNELRNVTGDLQNYRLDVNPGYTRITMEFVNVKEIGAEQSYNILLYLFYNSNEVRPCKILPDVMAEERLPEVALKKFNKYFKPFIVLRLKKAFEKIVNRQNVFLWQPEVRTDDIIELQEDDKTAEDVTTNPGKRKRMADEEDLEDELTDIPNNLTQADNSIAQTYNNNSQQTSPVAGKKKKATKKNVAPKGKLKVNATKKRRKLKK